MIRTIIGTLITRIVNAFLILLIVLINARYLGAGKVGTINLVILVVTIIQLVNNFVGGGAIVYLMPRTEMVKLFGLAYLWAVLTSSITTFIFSLFNMIPEGMFFHVLFLSLILSFCTINLMIMMGKEKIRAYNVINLIQVVSLFLVLLVFIFIFSIREVHAYIWSLYASYSLTFICSFFTIKKWFTRFSLDGLKQILKDVFGYGVALQVGNIFQFFN